MTPQPEPTNEIPRVTPNPHPRGRSVPAVPDTHPATEAMRIPVAPPRATPVPAQDEIPPLYDPDPEIAVTSLPEHVDPRRSSNRARVASYALLIALVLVIVILIAIWVGKSVP